MNITGNTILITGGGSGIGRGLAEALHKEGNRVIISGRTQSTLDETVAANPGMKALTVDMTDPASIHAFAAQIIAESPSLNVLINNAGIMRPENLVENPENFRDAEEIIATNLLGPIRLTGALLPHLRAQPQSTVMMVSSGLAFVPLAMTPTYCATKAAIHSWTQSLRYQLAETTIEVLELVPPYVQTHLMGEGQASDPRAMPLDEFITEVMSLIRSSPLPGELSVQRVYPLRFAADGGNEKYRAFFEQFNDTMHH